MGLTDNNKQVSFCVCTQPMRDITFQHRLSFTGRMHGKIPDKSALIQVLGTKQAESQFNDKYIHHQVLMG